MSGFRTTLILCQQCNRRIMVRPPDAERGFITCSHTGCGTVNTLQTDFYYDDAIVEGLPGFGQLTYIGSPETTYRLKFGPNVIGTSDLSTVRVDRYTHNGQCYISRKHCTLTVTFDKWLGQLRYQLQDGYYDTATEQQHSSLNGTVLKGTPLLKNEVIDASMGDIITLGGADRFQLTPYIINATMLATYKVEIAYNPDRTQ